MKIVILKNIFGYKIGENVTIGKAYINCKKVIIGDNVKIANGNNSRVINNHYFDVWNNITIGNDSWIAGKNSEFWTHGSIHKKQVRI
ncbi:hypothetical protein [Lacinutrix sp. MedPE-SW]|uniref:hypothetical protein n=1 Tax=Lacinutrix sp. MedPE-SW TaxID=1860087 RepID=UPI0025C2A424|nr:hypothetical protein [Lacinutrix sp. MedPE-SW]